MDERVAVTWLFCNLTHTMASVECGGPNQLATCSSRWWRLSARCPQGLLALSRQPDVACHRGGGRARLQHKWWGCAHSPFAAVCCALCAVCCVLRSVVVLVSWCACCGPLAPAGTPHTHTCAGTQPSKQHNTTAAVLLLFACGAQCPQ